MNTIPATIASTAAKATATGRAILLGLALACPLASGSATAAQLPEPALRASHDLDPARIGSVSEAERDLLRDEWLLAQGKGDGSRLVAELMERIARLEGTTKELGKALAAVPDWRSAALRAPVEAPPADRWSLYGIAALLALVAGLAGLWIGRRGVAASDVPASAAAAATPPAGRKAESTATRRSAVPPALTSGDAPIIRPLPSIELPAPAPAEPPAAPVAPAAPAAPVTLEIDFTTPAGSGMDDTIVLVAPLVIDSGSAPAPSGEEPMRPASEPSPSTLVTASAGVFADAGGAPTEDDQALELAEIMLSMGLATGAAQTLTEHIRANPKQALYHWLKLLDIHRKTGDARQFENAASELRQYFNIQADGWAPAADGREPALENYERIVAQIQATWKQPEACQAYLAQLLEDNRGGTRMGFPRPVAEEILLLREVLKLGAG